MFETVRRIMINRLGKDDFEEKIFNIDKKFRDMQRWIKSKTSSAYLLQVCFSAAD